jgi:hypothetical protein
MSSESGRSRRARPVSSSILRSSGFGLALGANGFLEVVTEESNKL